MFLPQLNDLSEGTDQSMQQIDSIVQTEETLSIMELIVGAGWYIMVPLGILGFIAIYITIERYLAIKKANKIDRDFMDRIRDYITDGKMDAAKDYCANQKTPMARMLEKGVNKIGRSMKEISISAEKPRTYIKESRINTKIPRTR